MKVNLSLLFFMAALIAPSCAFGGDTRSSDLLHQALQAQGGEQKLRALRSVQWEASGYQNGVDQSVRPEGPYFTAFESISEIHDLAGKRYRSATEFALYPVFKSAMATVFADSVVMNTAGGRNIVGTPEQAEVIREQLALSPERVLLTALDAADTHTDRDTILESVPQNVVSFSLDHAPVRIYLNAYTHLPTAVDYSGPLAHSGSWAFLGDVTRRTYYSFWWLARDGIYFPLQWNIEGNGLLSEMLVVRKLEIDAPIDDAALTIPREIAAQFKPGTPSADLEEVPLGNPREPAQNLAPGIVFIPGAWNVTLVSQDSGVVILEAPISSGYSAKVIAEAHRLFPGKPINAVVTTSDSWPHIAGIREYVAKGIPIYALDLNGPILQRLIGGSRKTKPDDLARSPRAPQFHFVGTKVVLGSGPNRIELYPSRGETSERQMVAYFPEHRLLYGSDLFQQQGDSFFYPEEVTELMNVVAREHLQVDRFFMMHIGATPWSALATAVSAAEAENTPKGIK